MLTANSQELTAKKKPWYKPGLSLTYKTYKNVLENRTDLLQLVACSFF
jgi:hypothetical protein